MKMQKTVQQKVRVIYIRATQDNSSFFLYILTNLFISLCIYIYFSKSKNKCKNKT